MKNLNLKSILFNLLTIFAITLLLSSCKKDQTTTELETIDYSAYEKETIDNLNGEIMILPFGIATESQEIRDEYFQNATPETRTKMKENARTAYYLMDVNKLEDVAAIMTYGQFFFDANLEQLLTEQEFKNLQDYEIGSSNQINSRCSNWEASDQYWIFLSNCCWELCTVYTRDCGWKFWANESYTECW